MNEEEVVRCGLFGISPRWLQGWATTKVFILVYGLLGTVQSMAFIYTSVILTTLEKRFKIPSQSTGIILSGNEISQILSVFLVYYGGAGHRTRWIAVGVACSALSCLVLAAPHLIYGPGQDALALTQEYFNTTLGGGNSPNKTDSLICSANNRTESCENTAEKVGFESDVSVLPRLLVFCSQFILGIGTTLYYGLGQTYMDDNTKKKNTPKLLGITFALRTVGPAFGFVLGYVCLELYIDPTLHPIIDKKDPRWLGAWWLGWIIFGCAFTLFAFLLACFPKELRKSPKRTKKSTKTSGKDESEEPLNAETKTPKIIKYEKSDQRRLPSDFIEKPNVRDFFAATKRILTNKILVSNIFSAVFYILSASPFMSFVVKYLEVQFQTSPGGGTIITGPVTLLGMVLGFLISGVIIGKYKPSPRLLLFWNVLVGFGYFFGQISYTFLDCDTGTVQGINLATNNVNLTATCNLGCNCDFVKYSPVCHEASNTTFFSACHAGCRTIVNDTHFSDCSCAADLAHEVILGGSSNDSPSFVVYDSVKAGPCKRDCFKYQMIFAMVSMIVNILGCSGKIGNVLVNYRCVETRDKSLAQGVALMIMSLFALIPGPIIFGAIMDSTCLVWDISCKNRGNCWVYHRDSFRYMVNFSAAAFCFIGVMFDVAVCYLVKDMDLYGEKEEAAKRSAADSPEDEDQIKAIKEDEYYN
ncbi:unnamed protein product [Trichogramma brassicae]|uniref:Solute carrier organic anion transporter family member n=1 Tax=Trichogramma brassicae TaxID=86971 RepID=A0A6H5IVI7_9HYME|nr:unnamed protein product [Trichogramma brassicae]